MASTADRKGALRDERSKLFVHVQRILGAVRLHFPWCQVHGLMESVSSMDPQDRQVMSASFGSQPWKCDAGHDDLVQPSSSLLVDLGIDRGDWRPAG